MAKQKKFYKKLKILNIYLKNITFLENEPYKHMDTLNISKNIQISHKEDNNVSYIFEEKIMTNNGEKTEIVLKIGIDINIEFNSDIEKDNIDKELIDIAKKITKANYLENKISLLIGNITSSFGENPIILPTDSFEKVKE